MSVADLRRAEQFFENRVRAHAARLDLEALLFGPQLSFVQDPANFATASCSRRAGKSVGIGAWLLDGPLQNPKAPSLYLTKTRLSAKRIIWGTLLDLNRKYSLGYEPNEADLILKRNGTGALYLAGIDNKAEIEKIRGTGWGRVAIDEAQSCPAYLKELVEDVLMPSLMDHDGQIRMIGTPAPVPSGYFYEAIQSPEWRAHTWTVWQNPHVPAARKMLEKVLRVRGITEDDPSVQREWFGRWVLDLNALVFRYDRERNAFLSLPTLKKPWEYVFGVDLGFSDSDAIAVLAFNEASPAAYLVEEHVEPKQTITQLTDKLRALVDRYEPLSIVVDTGGLGKKIAEEVTARTGIPLKAAEKPRKFEYIELLNDALRTGRFFAKADSKFAADALLVEWDRDKSTNDRRVVSERYHSDVCDAVLYAFRESLHWLHQPEAPPPPPPGTPEWAAAQEDEMEKAAEEDFKRQEEETWGESDW